VTSWLRPTIASVSRADRSGPSSRSMSSFGSSRTAIHTATPSLIVTAAMGATVRGFGFRSSRSSLSGTGGETGRSGLGRAGLQGGGDQPDEERVGCVGAALELRVGLRTDPEGVVGQLDELDKAAVRGQARAAQAAVLQHAP